MFVGEGPFVQLAARGDDTLRKRVREAATAHGFRYVGDYLRHLIDQDCAAEPASAPAQADSFFEEGKRRIDQAIESSNLEMVDASPVVA